MLLDARSIEAGATIETDICIVGAGPAGISLAVEFIGQRLDVCVLESGGFDADAEIQELAAADGDSIGDPFPAAISMRTRQYAGTANQWKIDIGNQRRGVRYATFDPIDFEKRGWVPHSGWPITKSELDPYYERAHRVCQSGPCDYRVESWEDESARCIPFRSDRVAPHVFHFGAAGVFVEDYRNELEAAANVRLCTYATALEIETDDRAGSVKRVCACGRNGNAFTVAAKVVVLALGGIENARLLLLSNKMQKEGLGNSHDLVGRFLMDHPVFHSGFLIPSSPEAMKSLALYDTRWVDGSLMVCQAVLSEETMRREELLTVSTALFPRKSGRRFRPSAVLSAQTLFDSLTVRQAPNGFLYHLGNLATGLDDLVRYNWRKRQLRKLEGFRHGYNFERGGWSQISDLEQRYGCFEVLHIVEQSPDPDNRVTLGAGLDRFGCRKLQIHWRSTDRDVRSLKRAVEIFAEEFADAGFEFEDRGLQVLAPSAHHHMGTTRMHDDPSRGVVDANCKVHGLSNLYVAGSSVFPTGGHANPTLTIVALALRLADHIKARMAE